MKRRLLLLAIDLFWIALSPFVALLLRENFTPREGTFSAAVIYAGVSVLVGAVVLPVTGLNRSFWRYISLPDLLRLMAAVTIVVLLGLFTTFALSRLEDIARSLPVIQWFVLVACMAGTRIAIRLWRERPRKAPRAFLAPSETQHVLIVGVSPVAELYLRSVTEFAPRGFSVVGILARGARSHGRLLRSYKVLGRPEDLPSVILELESHGVPLDRVIVVEPIERLSRRAREALTTLEQSSTIDVRRLPDLLGFAAQQGETKASSMPHTSEPAGSNRLQSEMPRDPIGGYRHLKRAIDMTAATALMIVLSPLVALIAVVTAIDVGLPVVFWQKRPGRYGHPFKLYKFRSMRAAHDEQGNRIPDEHRSSWVGHLLRRTRLDELPQLYNILVGEMSFIGPRPLLPVDHPSEGRLRLLVRPGLTGLAQVNGGRQLVADDKAALDLWYIQHISLRLDVKIALLTCGVLILGEKVNRSAIQDARQALVQLPLEAAVTSPMREAPAKD